MDYTASSMFMASGNLKKEMGLGLEHGVLQNIEFMPPPNEAAQILIDAIANGKSS